VWYKNIAGRFFGLVTKHACDGQTDGQTELRLPGRSSIAASRGKNQNHGCGLLVYNHYTQTIGGILQVENIQIRSFQVATQPQHQRQGSIDKQCMSLHFVNIHGHINVPTGMK